LGPGGGPTPDGQPDSLALIGAQPLESLVSALGAYGFTLVSPTPEGLRARPDTGMNRHTDLQEFWSLQEARRAAAKNATHKAGAQPAEPVRQVLASAHLFVADHLKAEGFHHRPRRNYLYRRSDGITHRILFQTSDANVPDQFIALYILFHVVSTEFAAWRHGHGEPQIDLISHRSLANFEPGVITIEHDLGPPMTRQVELEDALRRVQEHGLTYFAQLSDKKMALASAEAWRSSGFARHEVRAAVEFALFQGRPEIAELVADRFFTLYPQQITHYKDFAAGRRIHPSPDGADVFAWDLAQVVARHGLSHPPSAA
jgi:hypothetical protein